MAAIRRKYLLGLLTNLLLMPAAVDRPSAAACRLQRTSADFQALLRDRASAPGE